VERLRGSENIVALAKELGVSRRQLYRWRDELDPEEPGLGKAPEKKSRVSTLRKEVNHLKRVLAEKTLEVDFFKGALQKVEARRQASSIAGETASTSKLGK
jgi:transposase-like protein